MVNYRNYTVGGAVSAEDGFYIARQADEQLLQLCRNRVYAYVLAPRQVGKTSLMYRTAAQLLEEQITPISIDLTEVGKDPVAERWYSSILEIIAREAPLEVDVAQWWQEQSGTSSLRLSRFFREVLLREIVTPIIIFIDEIDTILNLDFQDEADNFYTTIRSLYEARHRFPELQRLSFVLLGVATPGDLIRDPKRTTLNIGQQVELTDWTMTEALPLAAGLSLPQSQAEQVLEWVLKWTDGHPYLTQRVCQDIAEAEQSTWNESDVDRIVGQTFFGQQSVQDTNLQFVHNRLVRSDLDSVAVLKTYQSIRRGNRVLDEEQSVIKSHLKISGVVKRAGRELQVRNLIYRQVFDLKWIKEHLPETLWQRLKPAMPLIATLAVAALGMGGSAIYANGQASRAKESARKEAEKTRELGKANEQLARATKEAVDKSVELQKQRDAANRQTILAKVRLKESQEAKRQAEIARASEVIQRKKAEEQTIMAETARQAEVSQREQAVLAAQSEKEQRRKAQIATADAEKRRKEAELGEMAARATNLLSSEKPVIGLLEAIQALNQNLATPIMQQIIQPIRHSLFAAVDTAREKNIIGFSDPIHSVAISGDGKTVAVWAFGNITLWDEQGREIGKPFGPLYSSLKSKANNDENNRLVVNELKSKAESPVPTTTITTTTTTYTIKPQPDNGGIAISSTGQIIASTGGRFALEKAFLWNRQGDLIATLEGHRQRVSSIAISRTGRFIVTGSWDKTIRLWDQHGNLIGQPFKGHDAEVTAVAISPDEQRIASGSVDGTVRLWDMQGKPIGAPFLGHKGMVTSVAFSPRDEDKVIASGGKDGGIRLWRYETGLEGQPAGQPIYGHQGAVSAVVFSPDRRNIISAGVDTTIRVWDRLGNPIGQPLYVGSTVTSLAVSDNEETLVSSSLDKTVRLWDLKGQRLILTHRDEGKVNWVKMSPNGNAILTFSETNTDLTLRLWKIQKNRITTRNLLTQEKSEKLFFEYASGDVFAERPDSPFGRLFNTPFFLPAILSPSGNWLLIASGKFSLIDLTQFPRKVITLDKTPTEIKKQVTSLAISPDGKTVGIVDGGKILHFWEVSSVFRSFAVIDGKQLGLTDKDSIQSLALSSNGRTIVVGIYGGKTIYLLDLSRYPSVKIQTIQSNEPVTSLAVSADGETIVGSIDETLQLWNKQGEVISQPFRGQEKSKTREPSITSVAVSANGQVIVSGGRDGTVHVWNREGQEIIAPLRDHNHLYPITSVDVSADGKRIVSGSRDKTIRVWNLGTWQDWLQTGCNRLKYHPVFRDPQDNVTKEAKAACQKYVWKR
jgi:WD40 repeat protein